VLLTEPFKKETLEGYLFTQRAGVKNNSQPRNVSYLPHPFPTFVVLCLSYPKTSQRTHPIAQVVTFPYINDIGRFGLVYVFPSSLETSCADRHCPFSLPSAVRKNRLLGTGPAD
jgi:hypothetical protein